MIDKIFLIGYRATGKSTIGNELASRLSFSFLDTDSLIRQKRNTTIEQIVATQGWDAFREYEAKALTECCKYSNVVIATGGGAILHQDFWKQRDESTFVVWLTADLSVLADRLAADANGQTERPTLTGKAIDKEIAEVLKIRIPLYKEFSDFEVDTGQMNPAAAVDSIVERFIKLQQESR